jgi:hypothetical protein
LVNEEFPGQGTALDKAETGEIEQEKERNRQKINP